MSEDRAEFSDFDPKHLVCECPMIAGVIYHDRATCSDPLVKRFEFYADTMPDVAKMWPCSAYGPEGLGFGAWCFLAARTHTRHCANEVRCAAVMAAERVRVFDRMHELAAAGDPMWQTIAAEFTSPDQILNGSEQPPE